MFDAWKPEYWSWAAALLVTLGSSAALILGRRLLKGRLKSRAEKSGRALDAIVAEVVAGTSIFVILMAALFAGSRFLKIPERTDSILKSLVIVALILQGGFWATALMGRWIRRKMEAEEERRSAVVIILSFTGKLVIWSLVVLLSLENLGVDVTALIAGLGVGGIAVALAAQNILADLFASVSIALDRPFEIGDFIVVDDKLGTVEHIGLKTTRIRSLSGEELIFGNSDLLRSRIRNFKRMQNRRIVFSIGVTYDTPYGKLRRIPGIIREVIEKQDDVRFDRAHFKEYGPYSLNFEVVYFVLNPDYNLYMDRQQAINLGIFERFEKEGIQFAYPTQTLYVRRETSATLVPPAEPEAPQESKGPKARARRRKDGK